ncbi:MAG: F0F1 ATP synthase subunit gamma [Anaerolineae bacterium]|nr:F0F1 ATP synthase subunit gamma [Anaerolineae bacterium]
MADMGEIRERLHNLDTIDHLIRSMRAMSAIRWRKARNSLEAAQRYASYVQEQLNLAVNYPTELVSRVAHPQTREHEKVGLIVVASDHGLCGAFNAVLFYAADHYINRWRSEGKDVSVVALGEFARQHYCNMAQCHLIWTQRFPLTHAVSFIETRDIWAKIQDIYQAEDLNQLYLIYNYFISFGSYKQRLVRLLPPELKPLALDKEQLPLLDGNPAHLQEFLLLEHLALQLYLGLVESMVSEQSARLQAMDAAKSNIDDRTAELNRTYHHARQDKITEEMLEIASGANSLSAQSGLHL